MNSKLLLRHRVNFPHQYINFLNFIHPNFEIISNLDEYDNSHPIGIIYTGKLEDDIIDKLNRITSNWIIVNNYNYDLDLSTNEGLIKNLLPLHYLKIKNNLKSNDISVYNTMDYGLLLEKIKLCLVDSTSILQSDRLAEQSVYDLYTAILSTPDVLNHQFFSIVNKNNVHSITSSVLTFLSKVQSLKTSFTSVSYSRLIVQSNKRYGKHIKNAINQFIKSKSNPEISLYKLLTYLNRAR